MCRCKTFSVIQLFGIWMNIIYNEKLEPWRINHKLRYPNKAYYKGKPYLKDTLKTIFYLPPVRNVFLFFFVERRKMSDIKITSFSSSARSNKTNLIWHNPKHQSLVLIRKKSHYKTLILIPVSRTSSLYFFMSVRNIAH